MKVCYFGDYDPDYPRHLVLKDGLRLAGAEVCEVRIKKRNWQRHFELLVRIFQIPKNTDVVLIGYSNSRFVWVVRLLCRKPVIWNAFYSIYDNWVFDRKRAKPRSLKALYLWALDFICCHLANKVILETNADISYWQRTFKVPQHRFIRILLGYNEHIVQPKVEAVKKTDKFIVHFHGFYIPLQGVPVIVEAAGLLQEYKDIHFNLIGSGQDYKKVRKFADEHKITNVTFLPFMPMEEVVNYIAKSDISIGLVGDVSRVDRALANKVYEASGMKCASINADSEAVRELFTDRENIILIERGNARDLADKILELRDNPTLRETIAKNAYSTVRERASIEVIGKDLLKHLQVSVK